MSDKTLVIITASCVYGPSCLAVALPMLTKVRAATPTSYMISLFTNTGWFFVVSTLVFEHLRKLEIILIALGVVLVESVFVLLYYSRSCTYIEKTKTSQVDIAKSHVRFHITNPDRMSTCCACCNDDTPGDRNQELRFYPSWNPLEVLDEIESTSITPEELSQTINENYVIPPVIGFKAVSYDRIKRKDSVEYVLKKEIFEQIGYKSWQNKSEQVEIPDSEVIIYRSKPKIELRPQFKSYLETVENEMLDQVLPEGQYATLISMNGVPGYIESAIVHRDSPVIRWFRSPGGLFVYRLLLFFGYSPYFEMAWRNYGTLLEHESVKYVSDDDSLPIPAGVRDTGFSKDFL